MTLSPLVAPSVHGVEGKQVPLSRSDKCVVPGCLSLAQELHHCWPRSYLRGQPVNWVHVEGMTVPNTVGLCITHHRHVTGIVGGHLAHIRWNLHLKLLEWWEVDNDGIWVSRGPLRGTAFVQETPPESHVHRALDDLCPTCGRPPKKEKPAGPKRKVKTWSISVPDDDEDGAEVLDLMIDDLALLMGFGDEPSRLKRFHVLTPVLAWVTQQKYDFIADWESE